MEKKRGWSNQVDATMSMIGVVLSASSFHYLPHLVRYSGGGAFFIPYFIMEVVIGAPLTFMFMSLGQYCSSGVLTCWKFAPVWSGIGGCMFVLSSLTTLYCALLPAWMSIYLFSTNYIANVDCSGATNCTRVIESYYKEIFTAKSEGLEDLGPVQWKSALALLGIYAVVFLFLVFGVKVYGKVAYVTTIVPIICMICLLVRAMTLPGEEIGVKELTYPQYGKILYDFEAWRKAFDYMIYRSSLCFGIFITFGSYNKFHNDTLRDAIIITVSKMVYSLLTVFAFGEFRRLYLTVYRPPYSYIPYGFRVYTVTMVLVLRTIPNGGVWLVILFLETICCSLNFVCGTVLALVTGVTDLFPILRRRVFWIFVLATTCIWLYLLALPLTTEAAWKIVGFIDGKINYILPWAVILVSSCYAVGLIYGPIRFCNDIGVMVNERVLFCIPWVIFKYITIPLLSFILPWTIQVLSVFEMIKSPLDDDFFLRLKWEKHVGRFLISWIIMPLFVTAAIVTIVCFIKTPGNFFQRLSSSWQPTRDWGPVCLEDRRKVAPHSLKYGFVEDPWTDHTPFIDETAPTEPSLLEINSSPALVSQIPVTESLDLGNNSSGQNNLTTLL